MDKINKPSTSIKEQEKAKQKDKKRSFWKKVSDGFSDWWDAVRAYYPEANDIRNNSGGYGGV